MRCAICKEYFDGPYYQWKSELRLMDGGNPVFADPESKNKFNDKICGKCGAAIISFREQYGKPKKAINEIRAQRLKNQSE